MKIGIISDIHGSYKALKKVLSRLHTADAVFNLGDVAHFTPEVNKCYNLLKNKKIINLLGNHEFEALSKADTDLNIEIGDDCISPDFGVNMENKLFIKKTFKKFARLKLDGTSYFFCHGFMIKESKSIFFDYLNEENIGRIIKEHDVSVVFCGHLHRPQLIEYVPGRYSNLREIENSYSVSFENGVCYGFNIGMLASDKNNADFIQYGILDTVNQEFKYIICH